MKKPNFKPSETPIVFIVLFMIMMLISPEKCSSGASRGLIMCSSVIIPSLFPFTFCVLLIMRSEILQKLRFMDRATKKVFGLKGQEFSIFLLSLISGYPVGARLINELYKSGHVDKATAQTMLCYCVNAGPAFIVMAVGNGILSSKILGYILLTSHILSSVIMAACARPLINKTEFSQDISEKPPAFSDNFVASAADAASSVLGICVYVILFCSINPYIEMLGKLFKSGKYIIFFTEVATAVANTKNIYFIAFILGFAGISVWLQVVSASGKVGIHILLFPLSRLLHGALSSFICFLIIKITGIAIVTVNNNVAFSASPFFETVAIAAALFSMACLLLISLNTKKYSGNFTEDLL